MPVKYARFKIARGYNTKTDQNPQYFLFQRNVEFWVLIPQCKQKFYQIEKEWWKKFHHHIFPYILSIITERVDSALLKGQNLLDKSKTERKQADGMKGIHLPFISI